MGALACPHRKFREKAYQEGVIDAVDLADQAIRKVLDLADHFAESIVGGHRELV